MKCSGLVPLKSRGYFDRFSLHESCGSDCLLVGGCHAAGRSCEWWAEYYQIYADIMFNSFSGNRAGLAEFWLLRHFLLQTCKDVTIHF